MQEILGDIWEFWKEGHPICITTNGCVKRNGYAVMGAGIALDAANRMPGLPKKLGEYIELFGNNVYYFRSLNVLTFPTKYNWRDPSSLILIKQSCEQLVYIANKNPLITKWYLPRPGCKNGQLEWPKVKNVIAPILNDERFIVVELDFRK